MWNYQSKVNYLCVKLRVHFRVFRKKMQAVVLAVFSGPSYDHSRKLQYHSRKLKAYHIIAYPVIFLTFDLF